jgi:hypothetical protein
MSLFPSSGKQADFSRHAGYSENVDSLCHLGLHVTVLELM